MTQHVSDIMTSNVTMVSVDSTVAEAERLMLKHKRRCVPVIDDDRNVFGVLSHSDILKQRTNNVNLQIINVWEICSHVVFSVEPNMLVHSVVDVMVENNVHHILVVKGKKVTGIVSVLDIIQLYREKLVEMSGATKKPSAGEVEPDKRVNSIYKL